MKMKPVDIALVVIIGLAILIALFGCGMSCKEGFLSQFGDQIHDPFLVDYANLPATSDPTRIRWSAVKRQVPVSDATAQYPYIGLSGEIFQPETMKALNM